MRRFMIVLGIATAVGLIGQEARAQQRAGGGGTATEGFQIGGAAGGGQGSAGNFGVGTAGQLDTNARYMRDNRQGAFVGADSSDTGFVGNTAAGSTNSRGNSRNIRGGGGGASVNQGGGRGRQQNDVRIVLQLGFAPPTRGTIVPARAPAAVASRLAGQMERSSWIQNRSPLEVTIDRGTATLRGVVATEHDRLLAERLALLEVGIRSVTNELEVPSAADSAEAPGLLNLTPAPEAGTE